MSEVDSDAPIGLRAQVALLRLEFGSVSTRHRPPISIFHYVSVKNPRPEFSLPPYVLLNYTPSPFRHDCDSPIIPPTTILHFVPMLDSGGGTVDVGLTDLPRREIGGLFHSEMWWRDRYRDLEAHGYRLRPRYHPDWKPSWKTSGKDFFDAEDGQPTIVRIARPVQWYFHWRP